MKSATLLLLTLFTISFAAVVQPTIKKEGDLENFLNGYNQSIVSFVSHNCPYCQEWAKGMDELDSMLKNSSLTIPVVSIDCNANDVAQRVCFNHRIPEFPTIIFFEKAKEKIRYQGAADAAALFKFINIVTKLPSVVVIETASDYRQFAADVLPLLDYHGTLFATCASSISPNVSLFLDARIEKLPVIQIKNQSIAQALLGANITATKMYAIRGGSPYVVFSLFDMVPPLSSDLVGESFSLANHAFYHELDADQLLKVSFLSQLSGKPIIIFGLPNSETKEDYDSAVNLARIINPMEAISSVMVLNEKHNHMMDKLKIDTSTPFFIILDLSKGAFGQSISLDKDPKDLVMDIYHCIDDLADGKAHYITIF